MKKQTHKKGITVKKSIVWLFGMLLIFPLWGQHSKLTVGAQIRPRAEFRNGFKKLTEPGIDPAFFIEQRARLFSDYQYQKLHVHINIQEVRIWGNTAQIYKEDVSLLNMYEAWARYQFNPKWSMKMGRMALDYDNARFFGNLDWAAQGRSHDAFLLKYQDANQKLKMDIGAAYNQQGFEPAKLSGNFYDVNNYKSMQFLWLNKSIGKLNISALVQNDGRQVMSDSSVAYRQTLALIPTFKSQKMNIGAECYYQMGQNAVKKNVSAWLLAAYFTFKTKASPITIGGDYLSGTDPKTAEENADNAFAPLYGTNHKFYGFMDYFYVGNPHGNSGLVDLYVKTNWKIKAKSNLLVHIHHFQSPVAIYHPVQTTERLSARLGTEIDLVFRIKLAEYANLNIGYSQLFATESMQVIKGGDHTSIQNWGWIQFNFNPLLIKPKSGSTD